MRCWTVILSILAGCSTAPSSVVDAEPMVSDGDRPGPVVTLLLQRSFGEERELPTHLLPGPTLLVLTDAASYRIDRDGRVKERWPLPVASSGSVALVTSASGDGVAVGATVRWGEDSLVPAGVYLARTDQTGAVASAAMVPLGSVSDVARVMWDGAAQPCQVLLGDRTTLKLDLWRWSVPPTGSPLTQTLLVQDLDSTATVGDWIGSGLCSVERGKIKLRTFPAGSPTEIDLTDPQRQAVGSCHLATSGRSHLVTWNQRALPVEQLDAGTAPRPDVGPGSLSYDVPLIQLVDGEGRALPRSVRATLYQQTATVESALWDGQRYLVLVRTAHRGGRLQLAALDESGALLLRELELPLVYEPGTLLQARLAQDVDGALLLVYSTRRPEDEGVLHLVRFTVSF